MSVLIFNLGLGSEAEVIRVLVISILVLNNARTAMLLQGYFVEGDHRTVC
jgi:hypothetical protein